MIIKIKNKIFPPGDPPAFHYHPRFRFLKVMYRPSLFWGASSRKIFCETKLIRTSLSKLPWIRPKGFPTKFSPLLDYMFRRKILSSLASHVPPWVRCISPAMFDFHQFFQEDRLRFYAPSVCMPNILLALPQPYMGADPILTSVNVRQGSRYSNHGGK